MFKKIVVLSLLALTSYIPYASADSYYEEKMESIRPTRKKNEIPLAGNYGSYSGFSDLEVILVPNLEGTKSLKYRN